MEVDEMEQKKHSGNKLSVEEHRFEVEGTEYESYLDDECKRVRGHPVFGVGDRLLDWRYNKDDLDQLTWWIGRMVDFEKEPCRICGDPRHICTQNPQVDHYDFVFEDGKIIGESERLVEDDNGNVIVKGGLYDKDTLSNVDEMEKV